MTKECLHKDDGWDRGWDQHKKRQLRRIAQLPMAAKLKWLEEAQKLGEALIAASKRTRGSNALDRVKSPADPGFHEQGH